jgi:WS/DGAT/MGAT family acyltransferase
LEDLPSEAVRIGERDPNAVELYARTLGAKAGQVVDASRLLLSLGTRVASMGKEMLTSGKAAEFATEFLAGLGESKPAAGGKDSAGRKPLTRFDHPVSAHRVVDAVGFPLADCRTIRQNVPDVTINDIFMAACSGALRSYLGDKRELPKKTMNAMVPMTTRGAVKDADAGNQIGMTVMPLRTDVADPIERLQAVRRGSGKSKAMTATLGKELPGQLIQVLPAMASKLMINKGLVALANVTVSNVRGPDVPLYMAGARLVLFLPVSVAFDNLGLNITGFSYNGTLWVCFVCCRKMMPDPGVFAECLKRAFADLVEASAEYKAAHAEEEAAPRKAAARRPKATKVAKVAKTAKTKKTSRKPVAPPAAKARRRVARKGKARAAAAK